MCGSCMAVPTFSADCVFTGTSNATETGDWGNSTSTAGEMAVGGTAFGTVAVGGDVDWIAIDLEAGARYDIYLTSPTSDAALDPIFTIHDSSGAPVQSFDDGPGYDTTASWQAPSTGTYYIAVSSWGGAGSGAYELTVNTNVAVPLTEYTWEEIATQLNTGYWGGTQRAWNTSGNDLVAGDQDGNGDGQNDNIVTYAIGTLTPAYQAMAIEAFELWSDVADIEFVQVTGSADITFQDTASGAYASSSTSWAGGPREITSSTINIQQNWAGTAYTFQTFIHEIGHALGLGHGGNYNGGANYSQFTDGDASYLNDSWQASVMSYFSQTENTFVDASFAYLLTPMIADIIAVQELYGAATDTRLGDTVYGYNNTTGDFFDLDPYSSTQNYNYALTVYDSGGIDTLDFSGSALSAVISLVAGAASNVMGEIGNLLISFGTVIENLIGTMGNDELTGNDANNVIEGGAGADRINGGAGNDFIDGGEGTDTAVFDVTSADRTLVRFGDEVLAFSNSSAEKDFLSDIELVAFTDTEIDTTSLQSNNVYSYIASHADLIVSYGADVGAAIEHYFDIGFGEERSLDSFDEWSYLASYNDLLRVFGSDVEEATIHYIRRGFEEGRAADGFDEWSYLASHEDLLASLGSDAQAATQHYVTTGYGQGWAVDSFDEWSYLASHSDLITAFGTDQAAATQHYVNVGYGEGLAIDSFDEWSYLASYVDLLKAYGSNTELATIHYVRRGFDEGRNTDSFDEWSYLASYNDLLNAYGSNTELATIHYVRRGYDEGRVSDRFDEWSYLASHDDLIEAFGSDVDAATQHFVEHGFDDGRSRDSFDEYLYIASHGDLIRDFGRDGSAATRHYVEQGFDEGRQIDFDAEQYLANYADLQAAYGDNTFAATLHFINHGFYEGRTDEIILV